MHFSRKTFLLGFVGMLACHVTCSAQDASAAPAGPLKVLVLGNSITRHGPKPDIGWTGNWGMAASAEDKDFSHLLAAGLGRSTGRKPELMVKNIADFERGFAAYKAEEGLKEAVAFKAEIVVLAIGENVPQLGSPEKQAQFKAALAGVLRVLKSGSPSKVVVRSSFWANEVKDRILKEAAADAGAVFVDISGLDKVEANYARAERPFKHEGVARHPGDKGMQEIADAILKALGKG